MEDLSGDVRRHPRLHPRAAYLLAAAPRKGHLGRPWCDTEIKGETAIIDFLRAKECLTPDATSLQSAFTYNIANFETRRVYIFVDAFAAYRVYVDWSCFFGGDYYLLASMEFSAVEKQRFKSAQFSGRGKTIVQPVPSKIIEYIRRFHPKLFTNLKKEGIVPTLPYEYAAKRTRRSTTPPLFQQRASSSITRAEYDVFVAKYMDGPGRVKQELRTTLMRYLGQFPAGPPW